MEHELARLPVTESLVQGAGGGVLVILMRDPMVGGERTTCASTASSLKLRRANARRPLTHSLRDPWKVLLHYMKPASGEGTSCWWVCRGLKGKGGSSMKVC